MRRATVRRPIAFTRSASSWQAVGLHAWWPLATGTQDLVRSQPAYLQGDALFQMAGPVDPLTTLVPQPQMVSCVRMDGAGDYIDAGPMPFLTAPFTLSCWFRSTNEAADEYQGLVTRGGVFANDTNFAFCVRPPSRRIVCYWRNGSTLYGNESSSNVWAGASQVTFNPWVHAAAVLSTNWDLTLYANGVVVGTDSGNVAPTDGAQNVRLGGAFDGNAELIGQLTDCRIYRRALSAAEIWQLYAPSTRWDLYLPLPQRWWTDIPSAAAAGGYLLVKN